MTTNKLSEHKASGFSALGEETKTGSFEIRTYRCNVSFGTNNGDWVLDDTVKLSLEEMMAREVKRIKKNRPEYNADYVARTLLAKWVPGKEILIISEPGFRVTETLMP